MKLDIPEHLTNKNTWQRILYTILFCIAFSIARTVLLFVVIIQILIVLFTGNTQDTLKNFGKQLSEYIYQITKYVTFNSDTQPFPFSDWPNSKLDSD